ncbi:Ubiquitin-like-specific protease 2 [Colletotrichum chlorophyti]|uniref:Ubiquitin-like-specific protease 2 n=1 Tax=Colletotrichum chlorophyti TaxID=708187 RepID=A0A1Q8RDE8_9PEZI|nr:Ubiquitin-like-specific protease 2 [Colletotrichum chlorophyti]
MPAARSQAHNGSQFCLTPSSPSVVDLTGLQIPVSQKATDVETVSSRSSRDLSTAGSTSEFRRVEREQNTRKRNRHPRQPSLVVVKTQTVKDALSDDEDVLLTEEPPTKRRTTGSQKKAFFRRPASKNPAEASHKVIVDDVEDDELAQQGGSCERRKGDDIEDEAMASPTTSPNGRGRADISRVKFAVSKPLNPKRPTLRVRRAVSGSELLDMKDFNEEDRLTLQVSNSNPSHLVVDDGCSESRPDLEWMEVKLNRCAKIEYTTIGAPIAVIRRSLGMGIPAHLLVIEFAEPTNAVDFGLWAEDTRASRKDIQVSIEPQDSKRLQKIFDQQEKNAREHHQKHRSQADDIKLLEHKEAQRANGTLAPPRSSLQSESAPPPPRTPRQTKGQTLRSNMKVNGLASTPGNTSTTSAFFTLRENNDRQSGSQRALPPRQAKDLASRSTLQFSPGVNKRRSTSPLTWIEQNQDWEQIWDAKPLIFPATGKNRTSVYKDDIPRLEEGQYLNDNLIGFYLRYLQADLEMKDKKLCDRIYFMNTYFYPKLIDVKAGRGINYDGVKSWTAKVDIFSYDYIIVPVNEHAHWYLAIICNPAKLLKIAETQPGASDAESEQKNEPVSAVGEQVQHMSLEEKDPAGKQKKAEATPSVVPPAKPKSAKKATGTLARKHDPSDARVITLDSLGGGHSPTCSNLKTYLIREAMDKKNAEIDPPTTFGMTAKFIPEQEDHASCGAYLLGYMREFLKDPDGAVGRLVRKEQIDWDITSPKMRNELRSLIIEQRNEQNKRQAAEKKLKRKSNAQPSSAIKSLGDKSASELPAPTTPKPVGNAAENPLSTVKGSPAVCPLPIGASTALKQRGDGDNAEPATETEALIWSATAAAPEEVPNNRSLLKNGSSSAPHTPNQIEKSSRVPSTAPPCVKTNARHSEVGNVDTSAGQDSIRPLVSSPTTMTNKKESASTNPKDACSSDKGLNSLFSAPLQNLRKSNPVSNGTKRSTSPSEQLLGELHSSASETTTSEKESTNQDAKAGHTRTQGSIVIEDGEPVKESLRSQMKDSQKSRYFAETSTTKTKSPLAPAKARRQSALSVGKEPRPSIEKDDESQSHDRGALESLGEGFETVDLTTN